MQLAQRRNKRVGMARQTSLHFNFAYKIEFSGCTGYLNN